MWDDGPDDDYDKPRVSDWASLPEARAAADASAARGDGSVLITWTRVLPGGIERPRYSWRDTDRGLDQPDGSVVLERFRGGRWIPVRRAEP